MKRTFPLIQMALILSILVGAASLTSPSAHANGAEELDPADLVPRRFSVTKFAQLSDPEIFQVLIAVRRGRPITIDGCTVSQSRAIIRSSSESPEAARRQAQTSCG